MVFKFCTNIWVLMCLHLLHICKSAMKELKFWVLIPDLVSKHTFTVCQVNSINLTRVLQYLSKVHLNLKLRKTGRMLILVYKDLMFS